MPMLEITHEEVAQQLAGIVADYGQEHTARGCRYFRFDGEDYSTRVPVCIVGVWLARHHRDLFNAIPSRENQDELRFVSVLAASIPEAILERFRKAQKVQDNHGTWGEALAAFEAA
jgi:hypothetical protein